MTITESSPLQVTIRPLQENNTGQFWAGDTPTFNDFLDTINPLQHIPIISSIYQLITGDTASSGSNIIGSTLYGGPIGLLSAIANEIVKGETGNDIGGTILAALTQDSTAQTDTASADFSYAPSPTNRAAYEAYMHTKNLLA
jgi:hypothetical protein